MSDIILIVVGIVAVVFFGLYFLNRYAYKKVNEQNDLLEKNKQTQSIYVIDKKKLKAKDSNLPKTVIDNLPKMYRIAKLNLVKVKIGPQILTLISDKRVWEAIPVKKNVKVEMAGIYIVSMVGMKSKKEMKEFKEQKAKDKKNQKSEK